jgi:adenylyltransferase/sulfurtransferase
MDVTSDRAIRLTGGRFDRFEMIGWWDQSRLRAARVLVVGSGALGNEVIKNLALLGVGHLAIADMDRVESTNLCRSALFRALDEGKPKAEVAAAAARDLYPELQATALVGNILADVGLGWYRWAEVVVGCLDNREARLFVNRACALVQRPWIDGGIDVLQGVVRGFAPPASACYECTMGAADWALVNQRRSCSLTARRAAEEGGAPTTPTAASVIGAIQAQEVVKRLHGLASLEGRGYVFEGLNHSSYCVEYPIAPDCPWHEPSPPIESLDALPPGATWRTIWNLAAERFGGLDALDLSRELVDRLVCACGHEQGVLQPAERIAAGELKCPRCGGESVPRFLHTLAKHSEFLDLPIDELGLPPADIVWARCGEQSLGMQLPATACGTAPPPLI